MRGDMQTDRGNNWRFGVERDMDGVRHECKHGCKHVVDGVGGLVDGVGGLVDGEVSLDIDIGEVHPSGATCSPTGVATGSSGWRAAWMGSP